LLQISRVPHPFSKDDFREDSSLFAMWLLARKEYSFDELKEMTLRQYNFLLIGKVYESALKNPTSANDRILNKRASWKFPPKNI